MLNRDYKVGISNKVDNYTSEPMTCGHCANLTIMKIISEGSHNRFFDYPYNTDSITSFLKVLVCPTCDKFNVFETDNWAPDDHQGIRLYPEPRVKNFSLASQGLKNIYEDAVIAFKIRRYDMSVAMCRKTIEFLCLDLGIDDDRSSLSLQDKIEKLRENKVIDDMLYDWFKALKNFGNDAVHAKILTEKTKVETPKRPKHPKSMGRVFDYQDAKDILDLTFALVEYCTYFKPTYIGLCERRNKDSKQSEFNLEESTINYLEEALKDTNKIHNYYAAIIFADFKERIEQILPVLIEIATNTDNKLAFIKEAAIKRLKKLGFDAVPELLKLLSLDKKSRMKAIEILDRTRLIDTRIIQKLIEIINDDSVETDVKSKSLDILLKTGEPAVNVFIEMYKFKNRSIS